MVFVAGKRNDRRGHQARSFLAWRDVGVHGASDGSMQDVDGPPVRRCLQHLPQARFDVAPRAHVATDRGGPSLIREDVAIVVRAATTLALLGGCPSAASYAPALDVPRANPVGPRANPARNQPPDPAREPRPESTARPAREPGRCAACRAKTPARRRLPRPRIRLTASWPVRGVWDWAGGGLGTRKRSPWHEPCSASRRATRLRWLSRSSGPFPARSGQPCANRTLQLGGGGRRARGSLARGVLGWALRAR